MITAMLRLAMTCIGLSQMLQGKLAEGMCFLIAGQLMDVQLKVDAIHDKLNPKKTDDE